MTAAPPTPDLVELASSHAFVQTIQRLEEGLVAANLTLFAQIDHAAMAAAVGLAMPPTTVLLYGNPKGGTPLMNAVPHAALDLPLRVLVREQGGATLVSYHPIAPTLRRLGVAADMADRLSPAQAWIAAAISD